MRKVLNLVIGGLQQKIFNLVIIFMILVVGAYTAVILWQANNLNNIMVQAEEKYGQINTDLLHQLEQSLASSKTTIIILLLIILVLGMAAALVLAHRIVKPINSMTARIADLGENDLQFMMDDAYRTGDEIEVLARSFADISGRTVKYLNEITTITAEKERIGAELDMAQGIQESQLPNMFPAYPDREEFEIYASMTPAKEVDGDFYDFFLIDDDHLAMVIADVSGKGVPAALFMMVSRILIKNRIQSGDSPAEALANVNEQLLEGNDTGMFVTVWLAIIEISTGMGMTANAGHEHPVFRKSGGEFELIKYRHSPAVGTMEGIPFKEHGFEMAHGDSLFVYTDGVAEATDADNNLFGTERMLEALNRGGNDTPEETLASVMDGIEDFVAGAEQFDDITMMCLKYLGSNDIEKRRH